MRFGTFAISDECKDHFLCSKDAVLIGVRDYPISFVKFMYDS